MSSTTENVSNRKENEKHIGSDTQEKRFSHLSFSDAVAQFRPIVEEARKAFFLKYYRNCSNFMGGTERDVDKVDKKLLLKLSLVKKLSKKLTNLNRT